MYTRLYALAMITTLMPHLRIGPYKEGVIIDQIQMPFHAVGRSFPYELLIILYIYIYNYIYYIYIIYIYILYIYGILHTVTCSLIW